MFTSRFAFKISTLAIIFMLVFGGAQPAFASTSDDFSAATIIASLPYSTNADTTGATFQDGEPYPGCAYYGYPLKTVWFSYTPTTDVTLIAGANYYYFAPVLAVYSGTSFADLAQIGCGTYGSTIGFQAQAGVTYYFQISGVYGDEGIIPFSLQVAPPPTAGFSYWPSDPSIFDNITFSPYCSDPAYIYGCTYAWDFGDGTTSTQPYINHQYARDGDYAVNLAVTTADGRTGTTNTTVQVRTRDVAITKLSVPVTARVNTTKVITVEVTNRRYSDNVRVDLYKGLPGGSEQLIGTLTIYVPAQPNRSTLFKFSYTFTGDDKTIGKVTFRAVATPTSGRDALPADNTAIKTSLVN